MKTVAIANPSMVVNALTEFQKTKNLNVSYHVARSFEDVGLIVPVYDRSGPGRAKKDWQLAPKGIEVLEKAKAAMDAVRSLYMDENGQPIIVETQPIEIPAKEDKKRTASNSNEAKPERKRAEYATSRSKVMKDLEEKMDRLEMLIREGLLAKAESEKVVEAKAEEPKPSSAQEPKVIRGQGGRFQKRTDHVSAAA